MCVCVIKCLKKEGRDDKKITYLALHIYVTNNLIHFIFCYLVQEMFACCRGTFFLLSLPVIGLYFAELFHYRRGLVILLR